MEGLSSMPALPPGQLQADTAMFMQDGPEVTGIAKKLAERDEAMRKRDEAKLTPKQLENAEKFSETMRHEDEKAAKSAALRKITDYARSFPDRIRSVNLKKLPTLKNTLEELETILGDIERDLGRTSSVDMLTIGYIQGMHGLELLGPRLKLKTQHLGQAAVQSERNIHDLMEEFCIKHDSWFSTSIEWRIASFTASLVARVHNANSKMEQQVQAQVGAQGVPPKMKEEANSL
jgi:hypothetical protein